MTTSVRILSWNVLAPEYSAPGVGERDFYEFVRPWVPWPVRAERLISHIRSLSPDIACLQEVSPEPWEEMQKALSPGLSGPRFQKRLPRQRDGLALLVRPGIEVLAQKELSFKDGTGFVAQVQHLRIDARELVVANAHLKWSKDGTSQPAQMRELLEVVDSMPEAPRVICGDFNFDVRSDAIWSELEGRGLRCAYVEPSLTWSANRNALRVDDILYGPGLELDSVEPLRLISAETPLPDEHMPSDHLPLCASLRLTETS